MSLSSLPALSLCLSLVLPCPLSLSANESVFLARSLSLSLSLSSLPALSMCLSLFQTLSTSAKLDDATTLSSLPALALACLLALALSLTLALVDALAHAHAFAHVGYLIWRAGYLTLPLAPHALTLCSHSRALVRAIRNPSGARPRDF